VSCRAFFLVSQKKRAGVRYRGRFYVLCRVETSTEKKTKGSGWVVSLKSIGMDPYSNDYDGLTST